MKPRPSLYVKELRTHGPTLVFLPGVGGSTRYWETRVAPLARHHRLVLVDLLGSGKSPKPWIRYTVDRHVGRSEPLSTIAAAAVRTGG